MSDNIQDESVAAKARTEYLYRLLNQIRVACGGTELSANIRTETNSEIPVSSGYERLPMPAPGLNGRVQIQITFDFAPDEAEALAVLAASECLSPTDYIRLVMVRQKLRKFARFLEEGTKKTHAIP